MNHRRLAARRAASLLALLCLPALLALAPGASAESGVETLASGAGLLPPQGQAEIPINAAGVANVRLSVSGGEGGEVLALAVRQGSVAVEGAIVESGEVGWQSFDLPQDGVFSLRNSSAVTLSYELDAFPAGMPVERWEGLSRGDGSPSTLRFFVATPGVYALVLETSEGEAQARLNPFPFLADDAQLGADVQAAPSTQAPLAVGFHSIAVQQDRGQPRTAWRLSLALQRPISPPVIANISRRAVAGGEASELIVSGQGFDQGSKAALIGADGKARALPLRLIDATQLALTLPPDLAQGSYQLRISNELFVAQSRGPALFVGEQRLYLPLALS